MKTKLLAAAVLGAALTPVAVMGASTTHTVNVSASVVGTCKFDSTGPTALAFGTLDQSAPGNATATTANIPFHCTSGTTSAVTKASANDSGLNAHNLKDGANAIPYTAAFTGDAQLGTGHAAAQVKNLTLTGTILNADYVNAPAGTYADTLTLTISP